MSGGKGEKVELRANPGIFKGLAKQNLLFHQCLGELVDNAIAARKAGQKFRVEVVFLSARVAPTLLTCT